MTPPPAPYEGSSPATSYAKGASYNEDTSATTGEYGTNYSNGPYNSYRHRPGGDSSRNPEEDEGRYRNQLNYSEDGQDQDRPHDYEEEYGPTAEEVNDGLLRPYFPDDSNPRQRRHRESNQPERIKPIMNDWTPKPIRLLKHTSNREVDGNSFKNQETTKN